MPGTGGLENITTFQQLVPFLRDELDWPIEVSDSYDPEFFDDITYDYDPSSLGLNPEYAAKIEELRQLRPLATGQPWGIFFVKFENKKIPISVLKRLLGGLVLKKRTKAESADQPGWQMHDLMFISSVGQIGDHELSFLHFSEDGDGSGKPILRELGWDERDPELKRRYVYQRLKEKLAYPEDETDADAWREQWASAFTTIHGEVISTTKQLTKRLAGLATEIRLAANEVLEHERSDGPLTSIYENFRQALFHHMTPDDFADMYAQTICYGLLVARIARKSGALVADDAALMANVAHPFLQELMETFLAVGGRKKAIDFNELGIDEVVRTLREANMEAVLRDFDNRNPNEDPILHFYEHFLKDYDAIKREQRGVYYTPRPVVSFIVRSVDEILQREFGLEDGLADITTWGEMAERNDKISIPDGVSPDTPFVQILDPATGTGTFLVEVIDVIEDRLKTRWRNNGNDEDQVLNLWNDYVRAHLLPRLHGFELLMAAYSIAHMKIGLELYRTGFRATKDDRLRVYLTNTLEEAVDPSEQFEFMSDALAEEARGANEIKRSVPITVIVGNPPYSSISGNMTGWIKEQVKKYLLIDGQKIREKSKRNHLQNDYVKFLRIADIFCSKSPMAILGFITSNSYLDGRTLRGLRYNLMQTFGSLKILNLFGDSNKRNASRDDQNVFQITEGVAIIVASRNQDAGVRVRYSELQGPRDQKFESLQFGPTGLSWTKISPKAPYFTFSVIDDARAMEFSSLGPTIDEIFAVSGAGMKSNRDGFATDANPGLLLKRIKEFADLEISDEDIRQRYNLKDNYVWKLPKVRKSFSLTNVKAEKIVPLSYRPFDNRFVYYDKHIVFNPRIQIMRHLLDGKNLAIVTIGQNESLKFNHAFVSKYSPEIKYATHYGASVVFPLFLNCEIEGDTFFGDASKKSNITEKAQALQKHANESPQFETDPNIEVFFYIYSILYSPNYRTRYSEQFLLDFPRIPSPNDTELFKHLVELGRRLVALHLLNEHESPILKTPPIRLAGLGTAEVARSYPKFDSGKIFINSDRWFEEVPQAVWEYHIGGYQVCHKWLKDRAAKGGKNPCPGRVLTKDDMIHYARIVVALSETIKLMDEIDRTINKHGGWPDAFYVPPPPPPTIEEIIAADEGHEVEYKSTFQWDVDEDKKNKALQKACLKTIAAFLNSNGGTLAIGVTNDGEIYGLEKDFALMTKDDKKEWFRQTVVSAINNTIGEVFTNAYDFRFSDAGDGKEVLIIEMKERGPKPAFLKFDKGQDDEFYIRTDNKTVQLKGSKQYEYIQAHWKD